MIQVFRVTDRGNSIMLSACLNISHHPLHKCHALVWNLWLTSVNKAYRQPVGRQLSALPRSRYNKVGVSWHGYQCPLLSSSGPPLPIPTPLSGSAVNTAGPIFTQRAKPPPVTDNRRLLSPQLSDTGTACTMDCPGISWCLCVKASGLSHSHTKTRAHAK